MKVSSLILFIICYSQFVAMGQISSQMQQKARQEFSRTGQNEDEVRKRLALRGIDLANLNVNNPQALIEAEKSLQEVLKELEQEKIKEDATKATTASPEKVDTLKPKDQKALAKQTDDISKSVKEGASVEEAISETIIDNQNEKLPPPAIYGQELFRSQNLKLYRKSEDVKPPDSYILGVGDIIGLSIWGYSEESLVFEIKGDGYIKPPGIPRIYLKGISFGDAKNLLQKRMSGYYSFRESEFEVTLNFARTINVSVVGETFNYGSFNIPAINTAFNALVAAGGPSDIGSVRNIKLYRTGSKPKNIDIYKYLNNPAIAQDFYLEENDIIFIPVAEKLIRIEGAINRPFVYELLNEENLNDLINYAGGMKANALLQNIQVKRIVDEKEVILNVNLAEMLNSKTNFALINGDVVTINTVPKTYQNVVNISGAVETPGEYAFEKGLTIKQLLKRTVLEENALLELSYITRLNEDLATVKYIPVNLKKILSGEEADVELFAKDRLTIYSKAQFVDPKVISIIGAVRDPKDFSYDVNDNINVATAIFIAGGMREDAADFGYIIRKDKDIPTESKYIRFDLNDALGVGKDKPEYLLKPNDVLQTFSKLLFLDTFFVRIDGDVKLPGTFKYDQSLSVQDAIVLAGGLKFEAARNRVDIYRLDLQDNKKSKIVAKNVELNEDYSLSSNLNFVLQPFDVLIVRKAPEFELQKFIRINGEVKYPGEYALTLDNTKITDVLKDAGGFTNEAFPAGATIFRAKEGINVVVDLQRAIKNPKSRDNILLEEGDQILIPRSKDLVTINAIGTNANEVYYVDVLKTGKFSVPFHEGKNAKHYIQEFAGGFANDATRNKVSVVYPNGRLKTVRNYVIFKKYPKVEKGSVITIGVKPPKPPKIGDDKKTDWASVFSNAVAQATAILTLILLIQRIE